MADTPLASTAQLGAYLQQTFDVADSSAVLVLQIASAIVRAHLQQKITAVAADVVVLDPIQGAYVFLPELPVTAVSLFEIFDNTLPTPAWVTVPISAYTVSLTLGIVAALPGQGITWPSRPSSWRVTYDHGFAAIPDALMAVCVGVAARIYVTEDGVDMERIGGYQVKYQSDLEGFSPLQLKAMAPFIYPRVA